MTGVRDRLVECFAVVFPDLPRDELPNASRETIEWDSVAMVTLMSLIEEEFGIEPSPTELSSFTAFDTALEYLEARVG
jgi:acyl carrier protein